MDLVLHEAIENFCLQTQNNVSCKLPNELKLAGKHIHDFPKEIEQFHFLIASICAYYGQKNDYFQIQSPPHMSESEDEMRIRAKLKRIQTKLENEGFLNSVAPPPTNTKLKTWVMVVIAVLLLSLLAWSLTAPQKDKSIFAQYFSAPEDAFSDDIKVSLSMLKDRGNGDLENDNTASIENNTAERFNRLLAAMEAYNQQQYTQTESILQQHIADTSLHFGQSKATFYLAMAQIAQKKCADAISSLQKLPTSARNNWYMAMAHLACQQNDQAIPLLKSVEKQAGEFKSKATEILHQLNAK